MLRWDPKSRGSGFEENRPKCFTFLETILNFKVKKKYVEVDIYLY